MLLVPTKPINSEKVDFSEYVAHPVYGSSPKITGKDIGFLDPMHFSREREYFVLTAVLADIEKIYAHNSYCTRPCDSYVDFPEVCDDCDRKFIFFAEEQKYWYEELGFYIWSYAVRCYDCRYAARRIKRLLDQWGNLIVGERGLEEQKLLVTVGLELAAVGQLKTQGQDKLRAEINKLRAQGLEFAQSGVTPTVSQP